MYKVYIEDVYQIEGVLEFCYSHNFKFDDTEEAEFLRIFSTKEEADKFIKECPLLQDVDDGWFAFTVHIEGDTVIDINGQSFSELKEWW